MDAFMDTLWDNIMVVVRNIAALISMVLSPLHAFDPVVVLSVLALVTVLITKFLNRVIITRRYQELEEEFKYWFKLREEAMKCKDYERGKGIAKNIDQAKLNRVYYDYFFEGFMLGLIRNVLPIILVVAYVNEYYRPEALARLFGRDYIFAFARKGGDPILIGSVFYYLVTLMLFYLAWSLIKRIYKKKDQHRSGPELKSGTPDLA